MELVGTGDAERALRQMTDDLELNEIVEFTGFVERSEMPSILKKGDLFVLPSQNEGMSIALLEAMAVGLPVVVTDTGGTEELVVDRRNGRVVRWGDVSGLVATLTDLIHNAPARAAMGEASRQVAHQFNWESFTQKNLKLCMMILENSPSLAEAPKRFLA